MTTCIIGWHHSTFGKHDQDDIETLICKVADQAVADARAQELILLGGVTGQEAPGYHDWNNLLRWVGLMHADVTIARMAHVLGSLLIVLALAWGAWLLWRQYEEVRG